MYDVIIIGGGVVGTLTLNELSKYNLKALLLEADDDVAVGASRANSGIVHAGYDCEPNTKKAKFNVEGHKMFPTLTEELDVPFKIIGSLVVSNAKGKTGIEALYKKGIENGVEVEIIGRERILELEPNVADDIEWALYAPKAGIVSPYKLTIAAADSAIINGCEIKVEEKVVEIEKAEFGFMIKTERGSIFETKLLINSAGANCVEINRMLDDEIFDIDYKRGDYFILDKSEYKNISTVLFPLPDENGKGILVAPSADGNVLYGPTSIPTKNGDTAVTAEGLEKVKSGISKTYKAANLRKVIRLFAGLRTAVGHDFVVQESKTNPGYFMFVGICSPGLSSAPALAKYAVENFVGKYISLVEKKERKVLPKHKRIVELSKEQINELVKENPTWGRVVCRCETVSEAEIINAIHSPLPATTVDAIKRRTRAGMGRCQGGFCMPAIIKILSRELGIPLTEVKKGGENSEITYEKIEVTK